MFENKGESRTKSVVEMDDCNLQLYIHKHLYLTTLILLVTILLEVFHAIYINIY